MVEDDQLVLLPPIADITVPGTNAPVDRTVQVFIMAEPVGPRGFVPDQVEVSGFLEILL